MTDVITQKEKFNIDIDNPNGIVFIIWKRILQLIHEHTTCVNDSIFMNKTTFCE